MSDVAPKIQIPKGRLYVGGSLFTIGFLSPLLVPVVSNSSLSGVWKTALSGMLVIGIPELAVLLAVAVMGKEGYNYLKQALYSFVAMHMAPPKRVGPIRHRIGLFMFILPLLWGWLMPYVTEFVTLDESSRIWLAIAGDFLLISSLFVLGGEFWDKLRALFLYHSKVHPDKKGAEPDFSL